MSVLHLASPDRGALYVVSGPSGVGKSTLIRFVLAEISMLSFSVSATTRAPRAGEKDGRDYHFIERTAFDCLLSDGAFLEHAEVYGRCYGTLRKPTEEVLKSGASLLLDIDLQGARQIRTAMPEAVHILILPPSLKTLERRLFERATDDEATIARRMRDASTQLAGALEYDYVVTNDDLHTARTLLLSIVLAELSRTERRASAVRPFIGNAGTD
jgi:guanylate kinase